MARTQEAEELGPTCPRERARQWEGGSPQRAAVPDLSECVERPGWEEGRRGVE